MTSTSYTDFQRDPDRYLEAVCDSHAPLRLTRDNACTVVLVSEDEYESMVETLHLLDSPANARRLRTSIVNADGGRLKEREIPGASSGE